MFFGRKDELRAQGAEQQGVDHMLSQMCSERPFPYPRKCVVKRIRHTLANVCFRLDVSHGE